jgi:hypothetical protein
MKLSEYIELFNESDEEVHIQKISNANALDFLLENAPRLECPDKTVEQTFAFRTWTVRKHLKDSEGGVMMSEFFPPVPWAGAYNTIAAALFHHLNEYRWFKNADILLDYIFHFIENRKDNAYSYYTPALTAVYEFLKITGNDEIIKENADKFEKYFIGWEERHLTDSGLYWSCDNRDAMEFSISGTIPDTYKCVKGLRPTLNSYMFGDAMTLSKIFAEIGNTEKSGHYKSKAEKIKKLMDERLWDGDFYKAAHTKDECLDIGIENVDSSMNVREIIGYNPWIYSMPDADKTEAFKYLKDENVFLGKMGFRTADKSHPRYLYEHPHECLWNGYVWPFATSQVLSAVISLLNNYEQNTITQNDLYGFIKTYAKMHYRITEDGKTVNWIDEVMHPEKPVWTSREILKNLGWLKERGGYERGKDYNHSTFIDIVLRGLIGIDPTGEELTVNPRIKGIWKWFSLENLTFKKQSFNIYYDEDGTKFNKGAGLIIEKA